MFIMEEGELIVDFGGVRFIVCPLYRDSTVYSKLYSKLCSNLLQKFIPKLTFLVK